jgi:hypothetical protein
MLLLPTLLLLSGLTLASLTRGARAGPTSSGVFEASFSDLEKIGESNYTHFWMPAPLTLSSTLPNARLMAHVDLCVVTPCLEQRTPERTAHGTRRPVRCCTLPSHLFVLLLHHRIFCRATVKWVIACIARRVRMHIIVGCSCAVLVCSSRVVEHMLPTERHVGPRLACHVLRATMQT